MRAVLDSDLNASYVADGIRDGPRSRRPKRAWHAFKNLAIVFGFIVALMTAWHYVEPGSSTRSQQAPSGSRPTPSRRRSSPVHYAPARGPSHNVATPAQPLQNDRYVANGPIATKASVPAATTKPTTFPSSIPATKPLPPAPTTAREAAKAKSESKAAAESSGASAGSAGSENASGVKTPGGEVKSTSRATGTTTGTATQGATGSASASGSASGESSTESTTTG
jgi:hypothetical protein